MSVLRSEKVEPPDNEDFVDLAGICGELRLVRPEVGYAYDHLRNVRHDMEAVFARRALTSKTAIPWAQAYLPLVMGAVDYFWSAVEALAEAVPEKGRLLGGAVTDLVNVNRPKEATPDALTARLKPQFVVTAANDVST